MTSLVLKKFPLISGLFIGAGILYGSNILMKRFFFYEEELSLTEELIKEVAVNTIQSVAEYCLTFHFPSDGVRMKQCYENESELFSVEERINSEDTLTLTHEDKTYLIRQALPGAKYNHKLIHLIL